MSGGARKLHDGDQVPKNKQRLQNEWFEFLTEHGITWELDTTDRPTDKHGHYFTWARIGGFHCNGNPAVRLTNEEFNQSCPTKHEAWNAFKIKFLECLQGRKRVIFDMTPEFEMSLNPTRWCVTACLAICDGPRT